jgi:hypothetical protein
MHSVHIVAEKGSHLLVAQGRKFAVLERRNNRLYNCHATGRYWIPAREISQIPRIIEDEDWVDEATGRAQFEDVVSRGKDLAQDLR